MTFKETIEQTPDISTAFMSGLSAIKPSERKSIKVKNPRLVEGSVDIDKATLLQYDKEPRWDYVIGYGQKVCFVEVHPANTSNVSEIIKKLDWLKEWLKQKAPRLESYPAANPRFIWAATPSGVHIPKTSKEYRKVALMNIIPQYPQIIG